MDANPPSTPPPTTPTPTTPSATPGPTSTPALSRRRLLMLAPGGLLVAGGAVWLASRGSDEPATLATRASSTTTAPPPTTTVPTTTTPPITAPPGPPLPPLPTPDPLPLDPWAATPVELIGTLTVPRLGIVEPLNVGMTLTAINRGPAYWPGTAEPGQLGNMVIAGHRTTYGAPFYDLDLMVVGDDIFVTDAAGTEYVYRVTGSDIVSPNAVHISMQTYAHAATLFACTPKGSAAQRLVVRSELIDANGVPVDDGIEWDFSQLPRDPDAPVIVFDGSSDDEPPIELNIPSGQQFPVDPLSESYS